jgi:hypothetical protein
MFWRVILDGEAESGMHSHSGEAGNFCYFNCSGDRQDINKRAPLNGVLMVGHFILLSKQSLLVFFFN